MNQVPFRARENLESGHLTGQTELKLDSVSFLNLITKLQSHSTFVVGFFRIPDSRLLTNPFLGT